jgi:hypothetical protein
MPSAKSQSDGGKQAEKTYDRENTCKHEHPGKQIDAGMGCDEKAQWYGCNARNKMEEECARLPEVECVNRLGKSGQNQ